MRNPPNQIAVDDKWAVRRVDEIRGELGSILDEDPDDLTAFDHNGLVIMWGEPYGDGTIIWGALDGKKVVAGGNFTVRGDELWEGTQAVLPQYQRRGIYRAVLGELREMYPMCKFQSDGSQSASMQALWRKIGARDTGSFYELPAMDNPRRRKRRGKNPVSDFMTLDDEDAFVDGALYSGDYAWRHGGPIIKLGHGYTLRARIGSEGVTWGVVFRGNVVGGGYLRKLLSGDMAEESVGFAERHRGKGLHRKVLAQLRKMVGPFYSDDTRTSGNEASWEKVPSATFDAGKDRWKYNPSKEEFYRAGEFRRKLKAVQQDIYEKTGNWMELGEVAELVSKHSAKVTRSQFRVVHSNPIRKPQTEAFRKWYGRSKVGGPVYHMTRSTQPFTKFTIGKSDLGAHFGTLDQAEYRAKVFDEGAIMPVWLRIRYPLRLIDTGSFHADAIAPQLAKKGIIPKDVAKKIIAECEANWRKRKKYDPMLRRLIQAAGYDGIVYKNQHEGAGDSWIAFDSRQIKSALANTGKFSRSSGSMTNPIGPCCAFDKSAPMFGSPRQVSWAKQIRRESQDIFDRLVGEVQPDHCAGCNTPDRLTTQLKVIAMVRNSGWAIWWLDTRSWGLNKIRSYLRRIEPGKSPQGTLSDETPIHGARKVSEYDAAYARLRARRGGT